MIACISGKISHLLANSMVVEAGGLGFQVFVPSPLLDQYHPGDNIVLHTNLIVRQDSLSLYGFETLEGREYFSLLLSVDGVGPKLALSILSTLTPDTIRRAVFNEQADMFCRVPGVGKKTSQKILLQMQDRLPAVEGLEAISKISDTDTEVLGALTSLGYSIIEAQSALQSIPRDAPQDVEARLRLALMYFAK